MRVFVFVAAVGLLTVQVIKADDDDDWDGFGEVDGSLYNLKPLSIIGFNTEQSSTYSKNTRSSKGVDGDIENGFFHTKDDERPFWTVQLKEEHCIGRVTLFNRKELCCKRLANAVVRAGVSQFYSLNARCGVPVTARQAEKPGGVIDVYCNPPLLASEVNVVLPNKEFLHLREVMLQEYPIQRCHQQERRLSTLNFPTEQSSEYDAARCPAERAADGFINKFVTEGFSHTESYTICYTNKYGLIRLDAPSPVGAGILKTLNLIGHDIDPWWRVDLQDTHCISKVVLFNRDGSNSKRLANAVVRAGTKKNIHKNAQCGSAITADQAKIPGGDLAVYCQRPMRARYVSVNIPGRKEWLHLREVEIYELDVDPCESDERDLSLIGKPTKQSSLLGNKYSPVTAADGNEDTKLSPEHICTHTKEEDDPWWMVDLQDKHCISKVVLLNRGDCCSARLTNAVVRAGTKRSFYRNPQCGEAVSRAMATPRGATIEVVCDPPLEARYISVDIPSDDLAYLQLCEVTVKELIGEDACREPEQIVIKAPEPQQPVEERFPKKVIKAPEPQEPVEEQKPKKVLSDRERWAAGGGIKKKPNGGGHRGQNIGGGVKIREDVPGDMGP